MLDEVRGLDEARDQAVEVTTARERTERETTEFADRLCSYLTASLRALAARNFGTFMALT